MNKKASALSAILMAIIAATGVAFAVWSSSVTIESTATIGTLEVIWAECSVKEQAPLEAKITIDWANEQHTAITLTADNIYPGWWAKLYLNTQNTGTLPLKYYSFQITNDVDDKADEKLHLAFYQPDEQTINIEGTFRYFETPHTYESDWKIPAEYITFQPKENHSNLIKISLDDDTAKEIMGLSIKATFELTAQIAK